MSRSTAAIVAIALIVSTRPYAGDERGASVLDQFLTRTEPALDSYEAHRTLVGWSEGSSRRGQMDVHTTFDRAARTLRFAIVSEEGSGLVRRRGLEAVLRAEAEAVEEGRLGQSTLTAANYDITYAGATEEGLYRLAIDPRRADRFLVRGGALVTGHGDLVRVDGRLAKSPSFWTTQVDVAREYARVGGVTVLVRVQSRITTRLFGTGRFSMTYRYQTVNGRPVE
ncbi:MAG: hypothetical protein HY657_15740 [Acidobacteria bacterium]|nr:hypothetical protein [Acidobacteriota bacterium]